MLEPASTLADVPAQLHVLDDLLAYTKVEYAFLRRLSNRVLELGGETGVETQPHLYPGSYSEYVERTGHEAPGVHA